MRMMKLLIKQFSSTSHYFLSLKSKMFLHHFDHGHHCLSKSAKKKKQSKFVQ
jgi:hypothetical protein